MTATANVQATSTDAVRESRGAVRGAFEGTILLRGLVVAYVAVLIALPLFAILRRGFAGGLEAWRDAVLSPTAIDAIALSLWTAVLAAVVNGIAGTATAWALVRWEFPGRRWLAAIVDLPLCVPTPLAGLMLIALYGPGTALGARFGIVFATPGILLALLFVTFPLTVRAVEPVLHELDPAEEAAAGTLGASAFVTFRLVILPAILPAIGVGAAQTFARALAEFGSLVVVSGNIPHRTLTAPVFVFGEVEGGNTETAAAASIVLLAIAIAVSLGVRRIVRTRGAARAR